jgi:recombination protein RecT
MAGPRTDSTGQIQRRQQEQPEVISLLDKMKGEFARALPRHITTERMMRVCLTALRQTRGLIDCSTASVLGSMLTSAQLGLEPNTPLGQCYLIPYKRVCQLIIGYRGFIDLAMRSGMVASVYAHCVRECDEFDYSYGLAQDIIHKPSKAPGRLASKITHVYGVCSLKDKGADPIFRVLDMDEVTLRRKRSAAANKGDGPWVTDTEAMIEKTAIRSIARWMPQSTEFAASIALDESPELGQSQVEHWSPEVTAALQKEGLVIDTTAETPAEDEPEPEGKPMREPGED